MNSAAASRRATSTPLVDPLVARNAPAPSGRVVKPICIRRGGFRGVSHVVVIVVRRSFAAPRSPAGPVRPLLNRPADSFSPSDTRKSVALFAWFWLVGILAALLAVNARFGVILEVRYLFPLWPALALVSGEQLTWMMTYTPSAWR